MPRPSVPPLALKAHLDRIADTYDSRYLATDPLWFVHQYERNEDREIVGLIAAGLAFGNVRSIQNSIRFALSLIAELAGEDHPAALVDRFDLRRDGPKLHSFYHRYVRGDDLARLLAMIRVAREHHGSLGGAFRRAFEAGDGTIQEGLGRFVDALFEEASRQAGPRERARRGLRFLLAHPAGGSACKRWNLYLRWMIRTDTVDLGIWNGVPTSALVLPLDTHTARISFNIGLTEKTNASWSMAEEITERLRELDPDDPVRYDFALSRLGILDLCPRRRDPRRCAECAIEPVCVL